MFIYYNRNNMIPEFLIKKLTSERITSVEMAKKIGISQPCLSLILSGKRFPSGQVLIKMMRTYPDLMIALVK